MPSKKSEPTAGLREFTPLVNDVRVLEVVPDGQVDPANRVLIDRVTLAQVPGAAGFELVVSPTGAGAARVYSLRYVTRSSEDGADTIGFRYGTANYLIRDLDLSDASWLFPRDDRTFTSVDDMITALSQQ